MQLIKCMAIRCNIIRESNVNPLCAVRALAVHCGTVYTSVYATLCIALPTAHELMRGLWMPEMAKLLLLGNVRSFSLQGYDPSAQNKVHPGFIGAPNVVRA